MFRGLPTLATNSNESVSRRSILCLGVLSAGLLSGHERAKAHETRQREITLAIGEQAHQAKLLELEITLVTEDERWRIEKEFHRRGIRISGDLQRILSSLKEDDVLSHVRSDQFRLAETMIENKVPLRPGEKDLLHNKTATPGPAKVPKTTTNNDDTFLALLIDLIFDSFAPSGAAKGIMSGLLLGNAELRQALEAVGKGVRNKNMMLTANALRQFFDLLTSPKILAFLERQLGKKAVQNLLLGLSSKFVPFVGQALLIGGIISAFWKNWDRIVVYVTK